MTITTRSVTLSLDDESIQILSDYAHQKDESRSNVIRNLIKENLAHEIGKTWVKNHGNSNEIVDNLKQHPTETETMVTEVDSDKRYDKVEKEREAWYKRLMK